MNAGLDAAIGDYVYEFDSTELCYQAELIFKAYQTALTGSDIVSVCPRTVRGSSGLFTRCSTLIPKVPTGCDAFRLVTRRAINRVTRFQCPPALPQGGLRSVGPENDRSGI